MNAQKADTIAALRAAIATIPPDVDFGSKEVESGKGRSFGTRTQTDDDGRSTERQAPKQKAFRRVADLCGYHEFSQAKMRDRLKRDGYQTDEIEDALKEAVRIGLINDVRWGEMRASAMMRKGIGILRIERELRDNGINPSAIDGWPEAYTERFGSEYDRAFRYLQKNPPKAKNIRSSAYGKLVRKGFSPDIAMRASDAWAAEHENHDN